MKIAILGATGRRPFGNASDDDEGELQFAIAADHTQGIVRVEFGKAVAWIGLPSTQARELAKILTEKADELDRRKA
jgi:hypothetical protein